MIARLCTIVALAVIVSGQINSQYPGATDCCEEYCYQTDEDPYIFFATKTAYGLTRQSPQQHIVPDCAPIQFWSLITPGTSFPEAGRIQALRKLEQLHKEIRTNYEERRSYPDRGKLCIQDFNLFRSWHWNTSVSEDQANALTTAGIDELKLLARRYKSKYDQVLKGPYDEREFYFQYSNTGRIHDSYQAYIEGLFGSEAYKVHANTLNEDKVLRGNFQCRRPENGFISNSQYRIFREQPPYVRMVHDVFTRLGFRFTLNESNIDDMYDMCRYEKAWNVQSKSPWCVAFTKTHLKMLEYAEDLKDYYQNGYGNEMSARFGCGHVMDFYNRFEKTVSGNTEGPRGTFLFSSPATLQTVLTAMGIAKDIDRPSADNFYTQSRRKWKTSSLTPFAANLAAVLYQCKGSEKHKVMFFLNEVPVEFPECAVGLCNWSTIQEKYENMVRTCNVNDPCNTIPSVASKSKYLSCAAILLTSLLFYFRV